MGLALYYVRLDAEVREKLTTGTEKSLDNLPFSDIASMPLY
jgi:hypothetical protein